MIDRTHALSVTRQAAALGISRGSVYFAPRPIPAGDLVLMRRLDALRVDFPFAGTRMLRRLLRPEFPGMGRRHVGTLMRHMGIAAMCPLPGTSRGHPGHPVFPISCGIARSRCPTRCGRWTSRISPLAHGFVCLAAVLDWASRRVLRWRVSITLDGVFCIAAVEEALARDGRPAIFNTDQGVQFTRTAFTGLLQAHGIQISMDGKGCWRDNIFVERLWRSLKYEEVSLHGCTSVSAATAGIGRYFTLYNSRRPHSTLTDRTPDDAYFFPLPRLAAA